MGGTFTSSLSRCFFWSILCMSLGLSRPAPSATLRIFCFCGFLSCIFPLLRWSQNSSDKKGLTRAIMDSSNCFGCHSEVFGSNIDHCVSLPFSFFNCVLSMSLSALSTSTKCHSAHIQLLWFFLSCAFHSLMEKQRTCNIVFAAKRLQKHTESAESVASLCRTRTPPESILCVFRSCVFHAAISITMSRCRCFFNCILSTSVPVPSAPLRIFSFCAFLSCVSHAAWRKGTLLKVVDVFAGGRHGVRAKQRSARRSHCRRVCVTSRAVSAHTKVFSHNRVFF